MNRSRPAPAAPPGDDATRPPVERAAGRTVYGVREILRTVRTLLEGTYSGIWVEGEIGGFKVHQSGHRYFELREAGGVLPAVMWRGVAEATRARPADGVRFRCLGTLTVWEGGGKFQMVVQRVEEAGAGDIAARIEALKKKLRAEGLTATERKRPLPWIPRSVGIVTSLSGAALRDVIKVLSRRVPVPIVVAHCAVQGDDAPAAIVAALRRIASRPGIDVVILTRGGGGAQDLAAFNEEIVARAVAACPAPVVTAVGHEVDVTVVDFVSDLRAATPSEAAERVAPMREDVAERLRWACDRAAVAVRKLLGPAAQTLDGSLDRAHRGVRARIESQRRGIERLHRRLQAVHPRCRLAEDRGRLGAATARLRLWHAPALAARRARLDLLGRGLRAAAARRIASDRGRLTALSAGLDALSPLGVLARGYSITRDASGRILVDASPVRAGDGVDVTLARGSLRCAVTSVRL